MFKRFILLAICLFALPSYAAAQTPTQDTGSIYDYRVQVLLPAAVHFYANVATNRANISSATVTVFQAGGFEEVIAFDPENDVTGGSVDTAEIRAVLPLDAANSLRPFEPVSYRWEVTIQDQPVSEAVGEFLLAPESDSPWQEIGDPPVTLYSNNSRLGVDVLQSDMLNLYQLLQSKTGAAPTLKVVIYEPTMAICETQADTGRNRIPGSDYDCSVEALQDFYRQFGITLIQRPDNQFESLQNALVNVAVGEFYATYWEGKSIPAWFQVGLNQLYRPFGGAQQLAVTRLSQAQDQLVALDTIPSDQALRQLWEAQSYLFLLYLADANGADAPFNLAVALTDAPTFESAFIATIGNSFEQSIRAWTDWIASQAADRAIFWNPYLQTTPTATPTRTLTPIPPSRTPTNTPTITLTPTSTSLIDQEPTIVIITRQPPTQRPVVTPSNTPLPPGSLPTIAPTSAPGESGDNGGLPCGAAAMIVPVGAIVIANRRKKKRVV